MENIVKTGRGRRVGVFAKAAQTVSEEPETATPMRPAMRDDDPRERARKRAEELRGHSGPVEETTDIFYVDPNSIPDGWTYEWKRHTVYGVEDPAYQIKLARDGWAPVPSSRHPEMMPLGSVQETILRDGLILMECPTEIVEDRRNEDLRNARKQVRYKEQQIAGTPEGTMTRDHARVKPSIKKSYEAMPIPEE